MASLKNRHGIFYAQYYIAGKQRRVSLETDSVQIAKEKLRQLESSLFRDQATGLPTRTPIAQVVQQYVERIRTTKTAKSAQTDVYYLREAFGVICPALEVTSRRQSPKARKRPLLPGAVQDLRRRPQVIEAPCFEQIATADVSAFITGQVQRRGLAPKTANRYREILHRVFQWAMDEAAVRLPSQVNPVTKVARYKERAPEIRFLTLPQIDEQLAVLRFKPKLQIMVAVLIYAGLRREELLWLTLDDVDLRQRQGGHGLLRIRAKTIAGESWQPKTKVNRAVPISRALRACLDRYNPRATTAPTEAEWNTSGGRGWFFPSPEGHRWDTDNFSADLRASNAEAGLKWGSLDYRHTFGSQLAQAGVSLFKIATLMGNSPEICRRHYAALLPESLLTTVEFPEPTPVLRLTSDALVRSRRKRPGRRAG